MFVKIAVIPLFIRYFVITKHFPSDSLLKPLHIFTLRLFLLLLLLLLFSKETILFLWSEKGGKKNFFFFTCQRKIEWKFFSVHKLLMKANVTKRGTMPFVNISIMVSTKFCLALFLIYLLIMTNVINFPLLFTCVYYLDNLSC